MVRRGQKETLEKRWREFFSDPSLWWDHRPEKANTRYPDFKHKTKPEALWLDSKLNPRWVEAGLAALAPGTVESNVFPWNTKLARYVKMGQYEKTMLLFQQIQQKGMEPDSFTLVSVFNACARLKALDKGRHIHNQIIGSKLESDVYVANSLVDMYTKCGSIEDAWKVFSQIHTRTAVSWNAMILGHVKCGLGQKALELSQQMQKEGPAPVPGTFVALLNACASVRALEEGRRVHDQIVKSGCEFDAFVGSSLIDMYTKCMSIDDAWRLFKKMPTRNVVSWSAMITGHVKCGQAEMALKLFRQMQLEGVEPDAVTYVGLLNACANLVSLEEGKCTHKRIIESGCEANVFVGSSLIDMYAKCGSIEDAWIVFNKMPVQDVVAWSAMILGCGKCGQGRRALELYQQMQSKGVKPSPVTFVGVLHACASLEALQEGRFVHKQIVQGGFESDVLLGSCLVDMYAKCGSIEDAWTVFKKMPMRNVVSWNSMIMGRVKCGQGQKALELSRKMQREGVGLVTDTYVAVLNACASIAALEEGRRVHDEIIHNNFESDVFVGSALVNMYAKCGSISDAQRVFNRMPTRDVVAWSAMLGGYTMHGHANEALKLFEQMCEDSVKVDTVTFVSLLAACSHAGLVDEAHQCFESMRSVFSIAATIEHYACMVDLLGRAGHLHEAEALIKTMPFEPNVTIWMALLGACRVHAQVAMGERAAKEVIALDPGNAAGYVLLSNIYAAAGMWDSSANIQRQRLERGVRKQPGRSWIAVNNEVHSFVVGDQEHPKIFDIHTRLKRLYAQMVEVGYMADKEFVSQDVQQDEKLFHLAHHSEKLAIAFGLISTPCGTPLRVFKNLRVCVDCHTAIKFIAKVAGRVIIIRDGNRFHHFQDGICSCRDFW